MATRRSALRSPVWIGGSKDLKQMFRNEPDEALCACLRFCQEMDDASVKMWAIKEKSGKCMCMSGYTQLATKKTNNNNAFTVGGVDSASVQELLADNGKKKK